MNKEEAVIKRMSDPQDNDQICQESQENTAQKAYQFENHTKYLEF